MSKTQRTVTKSLKPKAGKAKPVPCPFREFSEEDAAWQVRSSREDHCHGILIDSKDRLWRFEKGEWAQVTLSESAEWRIRWQAATLMLETDPVQEGGKTERWFQLVADRVGGLESLQSLWKGAA